ncbi:hypothetical protein ACEWY4_025233 [Coilia grayii]|uniref:ribonuclease H n=1 Tax=Coilia grayii TaxID=363190 RepID=A0ABD1IX74_9TELE
MYRQHFRSATVLPGESPKELFTRLQELFIKQAHQQELGACIPAGVVSQTSGRSLSSIVENQIRFTGPGLLMFPCYCIRVQLYPMPRVDDLIDHLGAEMDILGSRTPSKQCTAFRTHYRFYHFAYMRFWSTGAPATFHRLMVLEGDRGYSPAYINDVVIHSQSWEEHLAHVLHVLERLGKAGLTINPKKCAFAQSEVQYLCYGIGGES